MAMLVGMSKTFWDLWVCFFMDLKIVSKKVRQITLFHTSIIYTDLDCIIEKFAVCKNNPENLYTAKLSNHIPSGFLMFNILWFRSIKNWHYVYRGKNCLKKFSERSENN